MNTTGVFIMAKKKLSNSQFSLTNKTIEYLNCLNITSTTKLVLLYLTTCYNPKNKFIFPKQETIANKIGISCRSVVRAISELIKQNYCTKIKKIYKPNFYTFTDYFYETVHFINLKDERIDINYELWREAIYKKFKGTCQECGKKTGIMHAHHIKEYAKYPEKRYDIDNGILLCEKCHAKLHPWMKK